MGIAQTTAVSTPAAVADVPAHAHGFDYADQKAWRIESGESQSPIAIVTKDLKLAERTADENDAIKLHIASGSADVIDNGHTIQVIPKNSTATIRGRHFTLQQAHWHAPAEHTVDGKRYPLEGHFVFKAEDGRLAVIAVFYEEGAENAQFDAIANAAQRDKTVPLANFTAESLLPRSTSTYYHYDGSLTTPPLTENVEWYILAKPAQLSAKDIADFTKSYAHNARDQQPLNERPVLKYQDVK
ncbi:carbonic anhydrase family protein [Glaciimonas sp. GS1]|uniref:carbonic anhydrase n=2 Tax=Glaciimonas soli TaxID=2590999 RepID=A0A843YV92_9BURK|nr:carbonic anhydrase family protein [Glaciimonas soli]